MELFRPGQPGQFTGRVVWHGTPGGRDDAALILIDHPAWAMRCSPPVRWGRTVTFRDGLHWQACGVPGYAQPEDGPAELAQPSGLLNPGDGLAADRFVLSAAAGPATAAPSASRSPRGGLSGAAVFCGDLLTAVIAAQLPQWGSRRLSAVPVYVLHHDPAFRAVLAEHGAPIVLEPAEWQHLADPAPAAQEILPTPAALLAPQRALVPFRARLLADLATSGPGARDERLPAARPRRPGQDPARARVR